MNRSCQVLLYLCAMVLVSAQAQTPPQVPVNPSSTVTNNSVPPVRPMQSPVVFFRKLLAMSGTEREAALKSRPPETRERILAKVAEYQLLPPDEREVRLRATELRWWLTPMLRMSPADQQKRLAQIPEDLRGLAESRLEQWKILPPTLQEEWLANDQALHYFALVPTASKPEAAAQQKKISEEFNRFFELTAEEKEQSLNKLSDAEREQMAETLKTFDKLPARQREICVRNYAIFASMSAGERAEFLKNAEHWSKMSPEERQAWRDLVATAPLWPQGWTPPDQTPHAPQNALHPKMATNSN